MCERKKILLKKISSKSVKEFAIKKTFGFFHYKSVGISSIHMRAHILCLTVFFLLSIYIFLKKKKKKKGRERNRQRKSKE